MNSRELRNNFLQFFEAKGHKVIPSASLVPENDPTVLFTTAGMHPLVPYLMGEKHPSGKRLCDVQKCIRTGDIDEVGDKTHCTFFEMLGYWSLGDYFKKDAIEYIFEFVTQKLGIELKNLAVTCFEGDPEKNIPKDDEAADVWRSLGIPEERIAFLGYEDNWWGPAGVTGPCGPDTEMFVWTGDGNAPEKYDPSDKRWVEICNDVFMQYNKVQSLKPKVESQEEFYFEKLKQKNVDFGGGLERILAYLDGRDNVFETDLFELIIKEIERISGKSYAGNEKEFRIIADHLKAATFIINDGIVPSNKDRGYVLRRLIRRAIVKGHQLGIADNFTARIAERVFETYEGVYFHSNNIISSVNEKSHEANNLEHEISHSVRDDKGGVRDDNWGGVQDDNKERILNELNKEETKFRRTLKNALRELEFISRINNKRDDGGWEPEPLRANDLFNLYQSFGMPLEIALEEAKKLEIPVSDGAVEEFNMRLQEHQELSRTASAGMFKGGLADAGEETKKLHTAAHLMLQALRQVLGDHVYQKGSNITPERLRFDFSHPEKMTPEQIQKVEDLVNEQIRADLPISMVEMTLEDAKSCGAMGVFESKYGEKVKVYSMGEFSKEICGGPHAGHTGELGHFKIQKEESSSAGIRRIKAVLE